MTAPKSEHQETGSDSGIGCVAVMLAVNALLMGATAITFARGPYSSVEQELWYRYGSVGFFIAGFVLPGVVILVRRTAALLLVALSWLFAVLIAFVIYGMMSSGGI
jgi:hypothetical protein